MSNETWHFLPFILLWYKLYDNQSKSYPGNENSIYETFLKINIININKNSLIQVLSFPLNKVNNYRLKNYCMIKFINTWNTILNIDL